MPRLAPIALATLAAVSTAAALEGTWTATAERTRPDRINLDLEYGRTHSFGTTFATAAFVGLTERDIHTATTAPVRFSLDREAGRVDFEGAFGRNKGAGRFTFTPKPGYFGAVAALGVSDLRRTREDPTAGPEERLLGLTLLDVSTGYVQSLLAEGYRVPLDQYLSMRIFDVTPGFIRTMRDLGFRNITADELVAARIHDVTPEFVREIRAAGEDPTLEQLQELRIFDVTPKFRAEMERLGYRLSLEELKSFRIHDVTGRLIEDLRRLGYDRLGADELISARIFDVTPEFVRRVQAAYGHVPMSELISMRMHGWEPDKDARRRAI
jgi:hypothetical protein